MRARNSLLHGFLGGASLAALWSCGVHGEAQAAAPLPDGWVMPAAAQLDGPDRPLREQDPQRYLEVMADFDGDGDTDVARLLVDRSATEYALFVSAAVDGGFTHRKLAGGPVSEVDRLGIAEVVPGRYATACGKGLGSGICEVDEVILAHTGINLFTFEASAHYVFWDGMTFETVAISD